MPETARMQSPSAATAAQPIMSLLPSFPASGDGECFPEYRYRATALMRTWLAFELSDIMTVPKYEPAALALAESLAVAAIDRPLRTNEQRLLYEATRDILTVRALDLALREEDRQRRIEWELDYQEGHGHGRSAE